MKLPGCRIFAASVLATALLWMTACTGAATDTVSDEGTTEVGTTMGNPILPKTALSFLATTGDTTATASRALTASQSYCTPYEEDGAQSQECLLTPHGYNMGILAVYLIECTDASGTILPCDATAVTTISQRRTLYDGDQLDLSIGEDSSEFGATLSDVEAGITVGGIQVVTAYVEQSFPTTDSNATEAAKLDTTVQGITAKICMTSEDAVDATTMLARCGNAEARRGDFLLDQDDNGTSGFVDYLSQSAEVHDSETRPENYEDFVGSNLFYSGEARYTTIEPNPEFTTTDFYAVAGYFAPILPLSETVAYENGGDYAFRIAFDISNTISFIDGRGSSTFDNPICVAALADTACVADGVGQSGDDRGAIGVYDPADGDSDPASVGVFNPYYDSGFKPLLPDVSVTRE